MKKMSLILALFLAVMLAVAPLISVTASAFCTPEVYTIQWVNGEEILNTDHMKAGKTALFDTAFRGVPEKAADEAFTYTFIGWNTDPEATEALPLKTNAKGNLFYSDPACEDVTYYAIFSASAIEVEPDPVEPAPCPCPVKPVCYNVHWLNYDGTSLHEDPEEIPAGTSAWYIVAQNGVPVKPADDEYKYVFIGWNTDPNAAEALPFFFDGVKYISAKIYEDTTYYAIFKAVAKCCPEKPVWPDKPDVPDPIDPSCPGLPVYPGVPGERYSVHWLNYDGTSLHEDPQEIPYGTWAWYILAQNGVPVRPADENYRYVFIGWNTDPNAETVLPFTFNGFTYFSTPIYGETTFYAIYKAVPKCGPTDPDVPDVPEAKLYSVHWLNYDGTSLHEDPEEIPEGTWAWYIVEQNGIPTRPDDDKYTYEFIGWNTDPNATEALPLVFNGYMYFSERIYGETTYYAIYKAVEKEQPPVDPPVEPELFYNVWWRNYDGTLLHEDPNEIPEGTWAWYIVAQNGIPVKPEDENFTYEFIGWNTDPNATDVLPLAFNGLTYFSLPIYEDTTYYAIFKAVAKEPVPVTEYNVTWKNGSETIYGEKVEEGTVPAYDVDQYGNPVKAADDKYTYEFIGWNTDPYATEAMEIGPVYGDTVYYAIFKATEKPQPPVPATEYTITWKNGSETIYDEKVEEGTVPAYDVDEYGNPVKAEDDKYTYEFIGWNTDPYADEAMEIGPATGDTIYYAIFKAVEKEIPPVEYTVTWKNGDETIYDEKLEEGTVPAYDVDEYGNPVKAADEKYEYTFIGWSTDPNATEPEEIGELTGDTTYYAVFSKTPVKYEIIWDVDGEEIVEEYEYGETPVYPGKDDRITGWTPEIVPVTGNARYTAILKAEPESPKTGDTTEIVIPAVTVVVAACGLAAVLLAKKKKEN